MKFASLDTMFMVFLRLKICMAMYIFLLMCLCTPAADLLATLPPLDRGPELHRPSLSGQM